MEGNSLFSISRASHSGTFACSRLFIFLLTLLSSLALKTGEGVRGSPKLMLKEGCSPHQIHFPFQTPDSLEDSNQTETLYQFLNKKRKKEKDWSLSSDPTCKGEE